MKNIRLAYVMGFGVFAIVSMLIGAVPVAAAVVCSGYVCPPPPHPECVFNKVDNAKTACKPHGNACSPAAECRYKTKPGSKRPCGTTFLYAKCNAGKS